MLFITCSKIDHFIFGTQAISKILGKTAQMGQPLKKLLPQCLTAIFDLTVFLLCVFGNTL